MSDGGLQNSSHDGGDSPPLLLDSFREVLIRQEETIVFALIERAQFPLNAAVYERGESGVVGEISMRGPKFDGSFLDFLFSETERLHSLVRRYTSPDEHAFYPNSLCDPVLSNVNYPAILKPNAININDRIKSIYLNKILPHVCSKGEDSSEFGSTACADIAVLQALSKRVHYGKFIAEAKFQEEPEKYSELILRNDAEGIMRELTKPVVEDRVCRRVKLKASSYGQDIDIDKREAENPRYKVNPDLISNLYRDFIMPLTKEVQVEYLLQRLDHDCVAYVGLQGNSCFEAALQHFGGSAKRNFVPVKSIAEVFNAVMSNHVAYGVVPLEDSRTGMVKMTQELLISSSLHMSAEVFVKETHGLAAVAALPDHLNHVEQIFVPKNVFPECRLWVSQHLPRAEVITVETEEEGTSRARENPKTVAITTSSLAKSSGLIMLLPEVSALERGRTRYAVISRGFRATPSGRDRACLSMRLDHQAGALAVALMAFAETSVNLCRLESMASRAEKSTVFYVEVEGHALDKSVQAALSKLRKTASDVRLLRHLYHQSAK